MSQKSSGTISLIIFGSIVLAAGWPVAMWIVKPILYKVKSSSSWPATEGKIVSSELVTEIKKNFNADVKYSYTVKVKEYENNSIWFGHYSRCSITEFQKLINDFTAGKQVNVYYSPQHTQESC